MKNLLAFFEKLNFFFLVKDKFIAQFYITHSKYSTKTFIGNKKVSDKRFEKLEGSNFSDWNEFLLS